MRSSFTFVNNIICTDHSIEPLHSYVMKMQGKKLIGLLDTGAQVNCIGEELVTKHALPRYKLEKSYPLSMAVEGEPYMITEYTELQYKMGQYSGKAAFSILPNLTNQDVILGMPWMKKVNPSIPNWTTGDMFITKRRVNGKINTYRCKSIPTNPFDDPNNRPKHVVPTVKQLNKIFLKSKDVQVYQINVRSVEDFTVNSITMDQAAQRATAFAENNQTESDFYKPAFEEPLLTKPSVPHTPEEQIIIDKLISDNSEVLREALPNQLPPHRKGDGPIAPIVPGSSPSSKAPFKMSPNENAEIKRQLQEYLDKGFLVPSQSPWGAPVFLVKKPHTTKLRLVCDWRALNKVTIKNKFAIPHPDMLFDKLQGAKYFTKLDLSQGFHQLRLSEEDRAKSAITTRYGNYEWTVASFGMANVPSVFSRVVGDVLWEFQDVFVINFMDDILIYSSDFNSHMKHIQQVLSKLKDAQLYANPVKCTWCATSVFYLGHEISSEGIRVSKEKIASVVQWPSPKNVKELRSFLGLASYYRKFVKGFAFIAEPLTKLLAKDQKWVWNNNQVTAFQKLKKSLTEAPVLVFPNFELPFTIAPDCSSGYAIGGVLLQDQGAGLQPIAYESRKMIPAERNYPVHEQELLAILNCCKKWRHYIVNSRTDITTDHAPLKYLETQPNVSARQARWLDFFAEYDLNIVPQPGKLNTVADALSRRADYVAQVWHIYNSSSVYSLNVISSIQVSNVVNEVFFTEPLEDPSEDDNRDTSQHFTRAAQVSSVLTSATTESENQLLLAITSAYSSDKFVANLIAGKVKSIVTSHGKYILLNDIIYYVTKDSKYLLYISPGAILPNSEIPLQQQVIHECHDALYAGHYGSAKTLLRVQSQFHWNDIHRDVALYCNTCLSCRRNKPPNRKPHGLLQPHDVPFRQWETISVDFITHLPKTVDGYDAIMVVVDKFSKRAHFIPTTADCKANGTAQLFFDTVWRAHGLPANIISDRDSKFTSKFWQTLWRLLGTKLKMSTAFSPQTDGQTERLNRTLEEYLRNYVNAMRTNWAQLLTTAEYAYNSAPVVTMDGLSPFQIDTGQQPLDPLFLFTSAASQHARSNQVINTLDDYLQQFQTLRVRARNALIIAQKNQKLYYDTKRLEQEFEVGDKVFLSTKRYHDYGSLKYASKGTASVFEPRNLGPFKIVKKVSSNAYQLELPPSFRIHPVIHIRYLSKCASTDKFPSRNLVPEPEIVMDDGTIEFEVEAILKHRIRKYGRGSRLEYLIHWKGYESHDDTWEPVRNLSNCMDLVRKYDTAFRQEPQRLHIHSIQIISIDPD
jgi:transposase InsO family protein